MNAHGERTVSRWSMLAVIVAVLVGAGQADAATLKVSVGSTTRQPSEVEADYSTSHVFVNEIAGNVVPVTIFFDPGMLGVETAEIFTNLDRRNRATADANGDGVEDGIKPENGNLIAAGDDRHYYKAFTMNPVPGGYVLTLPINRCGAYRLTARYRLNSDPPGMYRWYNDETNDQGLRKRDHAIVVSPTDARTLQLYEVNPLIAIATGTAPNQRGTFTDLAAGRPAGSGPRFNLSYVKQLGCNAIWLQPIHPRGVDGRQIDPHTGRPFEIGSPYSVKNFFAVMPLLAKSFDPSLTPAGNDTVEGRAKSLADFDTFVRQADAAGVNVILDTPFNHSAPDVELAAAGQTYWGSGGTTATTELRSVEARVFSRDGEYDERAFNSSTIAVAPDRFDFGKWSDVRDFYFGRYAALVANKPCDFLERIGWHRKVLHKFA